MKVTDQTTLRELEDGLERDGFTKLNMRYTRGSDRVTVYEAILFKGEEWMGACGRSVAAAINNAVTAWVDHERKSGE